MKLTRIIPLAENLWAVNEIDKTVMYIINGSEKVLLIDTGLDLTDLKAQIRALCGHKPVFAVNTHAHVDHNSGNHQFAQVFVGRFDEPFSHLEMDKRTREMSLEMFFQKPIADGFSPEQWQPGPAKEIRPLKDNDAISLGGYTLEILEIPSHTIGSIALFERSQGWLFTGDVLLTWEVWGHLSAGTDVAAPSAALSVYYESLQKLQRLGDCVRWVLPAHVEETQPDSVEKYALQPEVISVYCKGVGEILSGERKGTPYTHMVEDGTVEHFPVGGIVYDKKRMG